MHRLLPFYLLQFAEGVGGFALALACCIALAFSLGHGGGEAQADAHAALNTLLAGAAALLTALPGALLCQGVGKLRAFGLARGGRVKLFSARDSQETCVPAPMKNSLKEHYLSDGQARQGKAATVDAKDRA